MNRVLTKADVQLHTHHTRKACSSPAAFRRNSTSIFFLRATRTHTEKRLLFIPRTCSHLWMKDTHPLPPSRSLPRRNAFFKGLQKLLSGGKMRNENLHCKKWRACCTNINKDLIGTSFKKEDYEKHEFSKKMPLKVRQTLHQFGCFLNVFVPSLRGFAPQDAPSTNLNNMQLHPHFKALKLSRLFLSEWI